MYDFSEIEEIIKNQTFPDFIENVDFLDFYRQNIRPRKGGGRDRISPKSYERQFEKENELIKERCISGEYVFSPYNEKLILKGRGKLPRVISVPTVRDRFVLSLLNRHLQKRLGIHRHTANSYIKEAKDFIKSNAPLRFFKTDIKAFFDSILHDTLANKLKTDVDEVCLYLILKAIKTPTCEPGFRNVKENTIGIPQGISIASVLSEKYMETFDRRIKETVIAHKGLYLRYVDDILILCPEDIDWESIIEGTIANENLGLKLTPEKTKSGILSVDYLDYVGYTFTAKGLGVKAVNQRLFSDRIASRCCKYIKQLKNKHLRPRFLADDNSFTDYSILDINLLISGFRVDAHNYGWLPYFQQITDLSLLYELDVMVKRICKDTPIVSQLNSFVKTYYALRHNSGLPFVSDFNAADTVAKKRTILIKMGRINQSDSFSNEAIEYRFRELLDDLTRDSKKDMKELS